MPGILLFLSVIGMVASWTVPDLFLLAGLCAVASLILLLLAARKAQKSALKPDQTWIVVDGSNVMYWRDGVPQLNTVRKVVQRLVALGYAPGVMFDANAGYLLTGRYMHDGALGQGLGLPMDRVMVVPKGVPADPYILTAARDLKARIVTNDRYRDWAGDHPEVAVAGYLICGDFRDGGLWLDLPP